MKNTELPTVNGGVADIPMHRDCKLLIVCSKNSGKIAPFIEDQVKALLKSGVICEYFTIEGKGAKGYLRHRALLLQKIRDFRPDLIHAHYGLSGLLANTQRRVPVVTTYHGSDINVPKVFVFSKICMLLSAFNVFVSPKNLEKSRQKRNFALIPCGVDTALFRPLSKEEARTRLGFRPDEQLVLFAGHFGNAVKDPELAQAALQLLPGVRLLELKGYSREEVALLMNAVDACLMTSRTEGSPQFVKEALACGCPVVSVDVGDVKDLIGRLKGCRIVERSTEAIAGALKTVLDQAFRIDAGALLQEKEITQEIVTDKLQKVYASVLAS